jgi:hypothetical protein
MNGQLNHKSDHSEKMVKALWCFACDTIKKGTVGGKCPICGSLLAEVWLKSRLNVERLTYVGMLILLALVSVLLLPMGKLAAPGGTRLSPGETVLLVALFVSALIVCSYGMVFFIGGYFGMPSGRALFAQNIPSEYPEGKTRTFSLRRFGMEAVKSLGILAAGMFIFVILKFVRSCTGQ